jgi:hypothetical protein
MGSVAQARLCAVLHYSNNVMNYCHWILATRRINGGTMTQTARTTAAGDQRPSGKPITRRERRKQAFWAIKAMGSPVRSTKKTAYNLAASIALPEHSGLLRGMVELLGYRVSSHTIRKWRNGQRNPPQWAVDILAEYLRTRARKMLEIADQLENQK